MGNVNIDTSSIVKLLESDLFNKEEKETIKKVLMKQLTIVDQLCDYMDGRIEDMLNV